jgi:Skp family chaperone for outer membrane proteins
MQRKTTKHEAAKLLAEFGEQAYAKAREAEKDARRRRNNKRAKFLANVARRIAEDTGKQSTLL